MAPKENFYRCFEERYRGSRELILERLRIYSDFLQPLARAWTSLEAVDLGCGRGEFLEVLISEGFKPQGVDLDEGMLQACRERGLPAEMGDALMFLSRLPDETQSVVSAFHVVEHLTFDKIQIVLRESKRVLRPGGILILETPNPENVYVSTLGFRMDPTHRKPLPPSLLTFTAEFEGFARVKLLRLQEDQNLLQGRELSISDVFRGVSPDYAIICQKSGPQEVMTLLDRAFAKKLGLSFEDIAASYDAKIHDIISKQASLATLAISLSEAQEQIKNLTNSYSWKLTHPCRWSLDKLRSAIVSLFKR